MPKFVDLTGKKFGRLTVIARSGNKGNQTAWHCKCECENEVIVVGASLSNERSKSCGCLQKESAVESKKTHGLSKTPEYRNWKSMIRRCENENTKDFAYYGARGIKVCERWRESFEWFLSDMGERPSPKHTIDRMNVNDDYCPDNCVWATQSTQIINRRMFKNNSSGFTGVVHDKKTDHWVVSIQVNKKSIYLGYFLKKEDAINARKEAEIKYFQKPS